MPFSCCRTSNLMSQGLKDESPVQKPELLYREGTIVVPVIACTILMVVLLFVDVPLLHRFFAPTVP